MIGGFVGEPGAIGVGRSIGRNTKAQYEVSVAVQGIGTNSDEHVSQEVLRFLITGAISP